MNKTTDIGIGHLIEAMKKHGFGKEEIKAMMEFLLDNKDNPQNIRVSNARFVDDCYSEEWEYNPVIIK